ncbi:MAG: nitroreductase family protein [Elusimicrobiaceae bacterium]|nr:nitroreductase family protein [Elusimicrobiaceae bacterium]
MTMLDLAQKRRSCYELTDKIPLSQEELIHLVQEAVKQAPSAFNSQSARVVILLGEKHHHFWHLVSEELKKIVPPERFAPTAQKISSFAAGYGTLLFFEDWAAVEALQVRFAAYAENFPTWAYQANGMLEYIIWTALAERNIGASLQHYNPLVDHAVAHAFDVPHTWKLIAQMPFGAIAQPPQEKEHMPLALRVRVEK